MAVCCCSLAGTAACQHCSANPFATDVWTNKTITVDHIEAKPFGDGLDVCPVCGKPTTIGKPQTHYDEIRAMNEEELAKWLDDISKACYYEGYTKETDEPQMSPYPTSPAKWAKWLKQEASE